MAQEPTPTSSAKRALMIEYKGLQEEPVEGFRVRLISEENLFDWEVAIFGPPETIYEGGYFKAHMHFPTDYPYSPPSLRFLTHFWHPNVFDTGSLCISILHPPVDDPVSGELVSERWNPAQTVRTVLLSVISLLNEPNTSSPANVEASVMYRHWRNSKGLDNEYEKIVRAQVLATRPLAEKEGVVVPLTVEDYCLVGKSRGTARDEDLEDVEFYDYYDDEDEANSSGEESSGNEES